MVVLQGVLGLSDARTRNAPAQRAGPAGELLHARLERYLRVVAMYLGLRGVETELVVEAADAQKDILAEAKKHECDLIALCVDETDSLGRGILGTTADATLGPSEPGILLVFPEGLDEWAATSTPIERPGSGVHYVVLDTRS